MSAAIRLANSLLRSVGGRTVLLQIPAPAVNGDPGEQLGLAIPRFQNVELGPVLFRKLRPKTGAAEKPRETVYELLVSASAVSRIAGSSSLSDAQTLFAQADGILVDGSLLGITWLTGAEAFGSVYLYRLGLRGAVANVL